jgi:phenylacetate-CoA ligase
MKEFIKNAADHIPYPIGKILGKVPMRFRLGAEYISFIKQANQLKTFEEQYKSQAHNFESLLLHTEKNIDFYKKYYAQLDFDPRSIKTIKDFQLVPIITKAILQQYSLESRSAPRLALKKSNTGGTTGQPLNFYLEKSAYAREWAHMHTIWAKLGYQYTDEKITIRGKNIGSSYYKYNFNQNEFLINAYAPIHANLKACQDLIFKRDIKWIHGYPSSVFSFLNELERTDSVLFEVLIKKVKGVFLGSEFPAPKYRNYIEKHCGLKSISWYGHSEMAVLAPEREPGSGVYYPFHSYGFAEAVSDGNSHRLIATSTHNFATPFIRYDTGDLIDPTFKHGFLESFRIKEGRNSDSVVDSHGRSISLTGLIFGRHHQAFDHSEHIQIRQKTAGKIEILITSKNRRDDWAKLFDFSNAFFDVTFSQIELPIRTPSGKVQLLLRPE